jgi:chromosome segregation ATPase
LSHDLVQIGTTGIVQLGIITVSVLIAVLAAGFILGKYYVRSADFQHSIETLRHEFRRFRHEFGQSIEAVSQQSIDVVQTVSKRATTISESLASVNSTWDDRIGRLEEYADAIAASLAENQKRALEENERTAKRLEQLEQGQKVLANHLERLNQSLEDQHSLIRQDLDEARRRQEGQYGSIEAVNTGLMNTQRQLDELVPRLERGEKARTDLSALINMLVKRVRRVNLNSAETALRVADLGSKALSKLRVEMQEQSELASKLGKEPEERLSSVHERENRPATKGCDGMQTDATPKADDGATGGT